MDRLVGILRTSQGLRALISRQVGSIDAALHEANAQPSLLPQSSHYEIVERSLDASLNALVPDQSSLREAWDALACVESLDAATLCRVLLILTRTVAAETGPNSPMTVPVATVEQGRPKPTAAHPRAYQGTKSKPPKPKSTPPVNVRAALNSATNVNALLRRLTPYRSEAIALLRRNSAPVPDDADTVLRSQLQTDLPDAFRLSLWPLVRDEPAVVNRYLTLYWEMELGDHPDLLASATRLVSLGCREKTQAWCEAITHLPRERRVAFTDCLIETGAYSSGPNSLMYDHRNELRALLDSPYALHRLFHLLRGLKDGIDIGYLFAGFHVADRVHPDHDFQYIRQSGHYPEQSVRRLTAHLQGGDHHYDRHELELWKRCGEFPTLGHVLETIDWTRYAPETAFLYVRLYADEFIHAFVAPRIELLEQSLCGVPPEYQRKFLRNLQEIFWFAENAAIIADRLPQVCELLTRLAQPPFNRDCDMGRVLVDFLEHPSAPDREAMASAPDAGFQRLEDACRRENDARLIGFGTWSLLRLAGEFSRRCFCEYPAKLFRVSKLLGCLPDELRDQTVRAFRETPLMREPIRAMPLEELCRFLDSQHRPELTSPVTRRLRDHLSGARPLKHEQLATRQAELYQRIDLMRLEALEQAALHVLQDGFRVSTRSDAARHALQILRHTDENRTALRKFLRAYWSGEEDYLLKHPRSQMWLTRHAGIDLDTWRTGIVYRRESVTCGDVRIVLEQDPLEALRLGTHVGSCLGLGGGLSYSAAAVVLDINKQVLYARDARGTVIARQVVAISDEERLVCFSVYPQGVTDEIMHMFAEYDRLFAQALRLPLYLPNGDGYGTVAMILSHGWWDDGARDRKKRGG